MNVFRRGFCLRFFNGIICFFWTDPSFDQFAPVLLSDYLLRNSAPEIFYLFSEPLFFVLRFHFADPSEIATQSWNKCVVRKNFLPARNQGNPNTLIIPPKTQPYHLLPLCDNVSYFKYHLNKYISRIKPLFLH